jgi:hypothetical protein
MRFPLWEDECFLSANYLDRGYLELLDPLRFHQVAPVLFLWLELTVVRLLGFSEWTLRLVPFACSVASVFLFRHLAGRLLSSTPLVLAVATFSVAYPGIRYAAEAKQYGSDLFVSLVLLTLAVEWRKYVQSARWLWCLTAALPLAIGLSYPAVFIAGGISLFVAATLWTQRQTTGLVVWMTYNIVLLASFVGWLLVAGSGQTAGNMATLTGWWASGFPPHQPLELLKWLVVTHASDLMAWPVGGQRGASTLTLVCVAAGIVAVWRSGRREWLAFGLAPFALQLTAAALHRYPYGVHVKFSQHLAPLICLLSGLGGAWLLARLRHIYLARSRKSSEARSQRSMPRGVAVALVALAMCAIASMARDSFRPYKALSDQRARAFAEWFWFNAAFDGEAVCLHSDFHEDFSPATWSDLSWSAEYLCNQRIYSPRHQQQRSFDPQRVAADHPLRCVLYRDPLYEIDESRLARWLAQMQNRYDLAARETYPFPRYDKRDSELITVDYLECFKFVPKGAQQTVSQQITNPQPTANTGGSNQRGEIILR